MCLALPAKVLEIDKGEMATVALEGVRMKVSLALVDDIVPGDYVLVHVGYALHKVSPEEAERTLQLMADAGLLAEEVSEATAGAGE